MDLEFVNGGVAAASGAASAASAASAPASAASSVSDRINGSVSSQLAAGSMPTAGATFWGVVFSYF